MLATTPIVIAVLAQAPAQELDDAPVSLPAEAAELGGRHSIRLDMGAFGPVGVIGVSYNYRVAPHFLLEGGVGVGLTGLQLSVEPKLYVGTLQNQVYTGLSFSLGIEPPTTSQFLNWDVIGYERRFESGFVFNVGVGGFWGVGGEYQGMNLCVSDSGCGSNIRPATELSSFQGHLGIGYWF
jgi:hypothetical protein